MPKQSSGEKVVRARVSVYKGRPVVLIDDEPRSLPIYSPRGWDDRYFHTQIGRFKQHRMGAYFLCAPRVKGGDFWDSPWWTGDRIQSVPMGEMTLSVDEQARAILEADPSAYLIFRGGPVEPPSWRALHPDQLVVNEFGETVPCASLASERFNTDSGRLTRAVIEYCESRPWSSRLLGYWNGLRYEGTHEPMFKHWLFDHSSIMLDRWRRYLREKYVTNESLRAAHGDPALTFSTVQVPRDKLLGNSADVARSLYWQTGPPGRPLRDYLLLTAELFHAQFRSIASAGAETLRDLGRERILLYDALKQTMQGWSNLGFFDLAHSWPVQYAELMAGSGHIGAASLFDSDGFDGVITPHDYAVRGIGGVYEPEGCVDSCVLRGKLFLSEMDTRTWTGRDLTGRAENLQQFTAVTWRNLATSLTRGFTSYWMDLHQDWFADDSMHPVIERQARVIEESINWDHADVPGIAVVIDDAAALETNGNGAPLNELVMWEWRQGLAHCGVPYRIYLFEDLLLGNFPAHRVFYFPNLFKVDDARLKLLRDRVFGSNRVVVWGPGSGISDGRTISPDHALRLTGFSFDLLATNEQRRTQIIDFDHTITRDLPADTVFGGPLAYGPALYPSDGRRLGLALTKQGRMYGGLNVKECRGWTSVFAAAGPLPAGLWRGLARHAGAHIWCEENDVLLADSCVVALHSVKSGPRTIRLPRFARVTDLATGESIVEPTDRLTLNIDAPQTRVFRYE